MSLYTAAVILLFLFLRLIGEFANAEEKGVLVPKEQRPGPPLLPAVKSAECFSCVACSQVTENTNRKTCPHDFNPLKAKKCVIYAEHVPLIRNFSCAIRDCASEKGSCEEIRKGYSNNSLDHIQLDYCIECEGDLCNSVFRSLPDMFFAFFVVVLTPIFAKHVFS